MSTHSTYDFLRHIADSYVLAGMVVVFLALVLWPFRPGARNRNHDAANMIFEDTDDGE
ncbi:CcoQ/FixQ family Cbb3-type cytochrome c oxidase assembly chaperone [Altererythrobacter salegens]|uniref:CcoQ/FixQ family Cbb3-type cytochrome c oxidase assembly chaperone n=1 Tax=Croceibacterium salegens TaxID=1737568 RepID=A0A6I4T190_9SPHN|nr:cbb3-type cytochrome c oxidase subunit 3 [Croceibacterium salegens]MXO61027.1 CcoQ/FixQ family Cbb3-type cytochrome c oxidase assembly chaperone [Croceibacterium salegens]